jgi:hypothetical protein
MPLAPPILGAARARDNARFANGVRNFVDRVEARLPGFGWLTLGSVAAILLMVVVGGFGTGAMPIAMRAGFWALLIGWNAVKWQAWFALLVRKPSDWWRASAAGALLLNLFLPLEIGAALALCGIGPVMPATTIWLEAFAISAVLFALLFLIRSRSRAANPADAAAPGLHPDGLLARAGLTSPGDLLAIVAEDHYCRVHINGGARAFVHHRFRDALDEVAALDGLRVHRGAWVADAAVAAGGREGRRWMLELTDGRRIKVSAPYVAAARARGWLRRRG